MTKEKFYENVVAGLKEVLGEDVIVELQEITKINLSLDGIIIRKKNESIAPTIYLNKYFSEFMDGRTVDDIVQEITLVYENNQPDFLSTQFDVSDFYDFEKLKEKIILKVINTEKNVELLKDVPHLKLEALGLSVVFYVSFMAAKTSAGILIRNTHMELWKTSRSELLKLAEENTNRMHAFTIRSLNQIMAGMFSENGDAEMAEELFSENDSIPALYVLTDENNTAGASQLYLKSEIRKFAEQNNCNIIILPSSVHELLLLREDYANLPSDYDYLKNMVCEVNSTIDESDFLYDGAFMYVRNEDKIVAL